MILVSSARRFPEDRDATRVKGQQSKVLRFGVSRRGSDGMSLRVTGSDPMQALDGGASSSLSCVRGVTVLVVAMKDRGLSLDVDVVVEKKDVGEGIEDDVSGGRSDGEDGIVGTEGGARTVARIDSFELVVLGPRKGSFDDVIAAPRRKTHPSRSRHDDGTIVSYVIVVVHLGTTIQ